MFFAPPVKVPRTQRLTVTSSAAAPYIYKRATEADSGLAEAPPASLDGAVLFDTANACTMPVSSFLSGAGTHMFWLVDENTKLLRLWNVSRSGWQSTAPRLAEIPYFAAAKEGLPLFVSEMSGEEESLAFCSERGAISSLDHSIEIQMMDADDADLTASSFVCARRRVNAEMVIVTVLGTTAGVLVVDLKHDGSHTTMKFDRRDPTSFRWAHGGRNNLLQGSGISSTERSGAEHFADSAEEESQQRLSNEDSEAGRPLSSPNTSSWLWHSLKSLVAVGNRTSDDRQLSATGTRASQRDARDASHTTEQARTVTGGAANASFAWPLSAIGHSRRGDGPFAFTHVQLRCHYPGQVVAINASGEVFLIDFSPVPPPAAGTVLRSHMSVKWASSLPALLGRSGHVVSGTESRHKVFVLYYVRGSSAHPLPALWLVTLDASLGRVVNYVVLNAVADVVRAAAHLPPHHIKVFADDFRREVLISIGAYVLRVNNQVGVRQPCSSEDIVCFAHLEQPVVSLLREDGSLVTLDAHGPHLTVRDALAGRLALVAGGDSYRRVLQGDDSGEAELKCILDAVRTDSTLSLDCAVLYTSEALSSVDSLHQRRHGDAIRSNSSSSGVGTGNWARRNLNVEDENIVRRVTCQLTCKQQTHRSFLMAVLRHEQVRAELSHATIAQLASVQEALVSLCALRSMQNVGLQARSLCSANEDDLAQRVLPPFSAMLEAAPSGDGAYLLQRRPSSLPTTQNSNNDASSAPSVPRLVKNTAQMERCQQIMRRAIVTVAEAIRTEQNVARSGGSTALEGSVEGLTAAEICFAHPFNLVRLLRFIVAYMSDVRQTVLLPLEEKFAECYAAGCIYVVVAQTIVESREDMRRVYNIPKDFLACMWTSSSDLVTGVAPCFSQACVQLSNTLADVCDVASGNNECSIDGYVNAVDGEARAAGAAAFASLSLQHKCDMLDVIAYLLYFSLANSLQHDSRFVASAVTNTLLREPFLTGPVGYPYGAPIPSRGCAEIGRRVLRVCEAIALRFDAMPILMIFALSAPIDDPVSFPGHYERLQCYCQQNTLALDAALQTLWEQRREWELLSLPAVLPGCPDARTRRNDFLEAQAPHLLWLADPDRYDAITAEGQTSPPYIPYGEVQLKHRSRCNAMARLAWVAAGATPSSHINEVELSESIVAAQQEFLAPDYNVVTLGPQAAVQRLLEIQNCVAAWVQAAVIASRTMQPTSDDLLVQVLRRCRAKDGESRLRSIFANSVSELETDANLRKTALGQVLMGCAKLQDVDTLRRVCETLLTAEEFALLSSWLAYLWTASHEAA